MSGKGCQLLVSPCSMSPSLGMIKGHQAQSVHASPLQRDELSPSGGVEKVKKRVLQTFGSEEQARSHVVLPALSLRRQVLTNGKHVNMAAECPPHQPGPSQHTPASTGHRLSNKFRGKGLKTVG